MVGVWVLVGHVCKIPVDHVTYHTRCLKISGLYYYFKRGKALNFYKKGEHEG